MALQAPKLLLGIAIVLTAGFAGWSAGTSFGMRQGMAMERQTNLYAFQKMQHQPDAPSTIAYLQTLQQLHQDLMIVYQGEPDIDYVRLTIPLIEAQISLCEKHKVNSQNLQITAFCEKVTSQLKTNLQELRDWSENSGVRTE
jgi:uncharacterized protein (DUF305 family)